MYLAAVNNREEYIRSVCGRQDGRTTIFSFFSYPCLSSESGKGSPSLRCLAAAAWCRLLFILWWSSPNLICISIAVGIDCCDTIAIVNCVWSTLTWKPGKHFLVWSLLEARFSVSTCRWRTGQWWIRNVGKHAKYLPRKVLSLIHTCNYS